MPVLTCNINVFWCWNWIRDWDKNQIKLFEEKESIGFTQFKRKHLIRHAISNRLRWMKPVHWENSCKEIRISNDAEETWRWDGRTTWKKIWFLIAVDLSNWRCRAQDHNGCRQFLNEALNQSFSKEIQNYRYKTFVLVTLKTFFIQFCLWFYRIW